MIQFINYKLIITQVLTLGNGFAVYYLQLFVLIMKACGGKLKKNRKGQKNRFLYIQVMVRFY